MSLRHRQSPARASIRLLARLLVPLAAGCAAESQPSEALHTVMPAPGVPAAAPYPNLPSGKALDDGASVPNAAPAADAIPAPSANGSATVEAAVVAPDLADTNAGESGDGALEPKPVRDPSLGMVAQYLPLPRSWKITQGKKGMAIHGPHGLAVTFNAPKHGMAPSGDAAVDAANRQQGMSVRPAPTFANFLKSELKPWAQQQGWRFKASYALPAVARANAAYDKQLYKFFPTQDRFDSYGTDWVDGAGKPHFVGVALVTTRYEYGVQWRNSTVVLSAEPAYFEQAKAHLLQSFRDARANPRHIQTVNRRTKAESERSWAAHQRRLRNNQAAFDAQQRAHRASSQAMNDAIMGNWRAQQAASDRSHRRFVDQIREVETARDDKGQRFEVESGATQYWMNEEGQYVPTDDPSYDPNADPNVNHENWRQLEVEDN